MLAADAPIPILLLIDKLPRAGAQTHVYQLASQLDRRRFQPRVCCLAWGGALADRLSAEGVPVSVLGVERIYGAPALRGMLRLVRELRRERIQILHTFLTSANVFGTVAARLAHVPVVVTSRRDTGFARSRRLGMVEEWIVNPLADQVVAVSEAAADAARKERGTTGKVVTIPNGIALGDGAARPDRDGYRRQWGVAAGDKVVGMVANFNPVKGHAELLEAAARVLAARPEARFVLVGDGPLRPAIEAQAARLGIAGRLVLTGVRDDVRDLLSGFDVGVLSSHTEGMSNVLLEYLAAGLPVVATAVGGNPELLEDGVSGRLVPARDPAAMASALLEVLADDGEAARLGAAGRRFVRESLSLERMVRRHEDLYTALLAGKT